MDDQGEVFLGIDVAKLRNAVAVAEAGRQGEVRYLGEFDADEASMCRLVKRLAAKHERVTFCYEAGPTGYGLSLTHFRGNLLVLTPYCAICAKPVRPVVPLEAA